MSDVMETSISVTHIQSVLKHLLESYLVEKEESVRHDDTSFVTYWESACQTIYEVAADLNIPFEEKPSTSRPHKQYQPDSIAPDNADVYMREIGDLRITLCVEHPKSHC